MVLLWRALHCFKTGIKYASVSRGRLDKKIWWNDPVYRYLLWSYRCRSCPPCPRQTPSEGKTQSRPFPVPFLPKAQNSNIIWQKPPLSQEEPVAADFFNNDFKNTAFISGTAGCLRRLVRLLKLTRCLNSCLSSMVIVSAFAMTGTMLTEWLRRLMNSASNWRRLWGKEEKSNVLTFLKMLRRCQKDLMLAVLQKKTLFIYPWRRNLCYQ